MTSDIKPLAYPDTLAPHMTHVWLEQHSTPHDSLGLAFRVLTHDIQVWKKTHLEKNTWDGQGLVELVLPAGTVIYADMLRRSPEALNEDSISQRKMRANQALVVHQEVIPSHWHKKSGEVQISYSDWDPNFVYITGAAVAPDDDFSTRNDQCTSGIHFFVRREDALVYDL